MPDASKNGPNSDVTLERSSLRERVKDVILRRIVDGTYLPGSRLVETRIAQEMGISQTSVREALRDLEHLGCVVYEPYRGCSVRELSIAELIEAFPVRSALEALGARLAAESISDATLVKLKSCCDAMVAAAERGDAGDLSWADGDFHATIVAAAGNATLKRQWAFLEPYARTYITVTRPGTDLVSLAAEHQPILAALQARDSDRAADSMRDHLLCVSERLREASDLSVDGVAA